MLAIIVILIILAYAVIYAYSNSTENKKKMMFLFLSGLLLVLYAGLKSEFLYSDLPGYIAKYDYYKTRTWRQVLDLYSSDAKDPVYYILGWLFSRIFESAYVWIGAIAAIYVGAVFRLIYRYSPSPLLSVLLFLALGFFSFSLSGLRQALSMAITANAILYLADKKPVKFYIAVILASTVHLSAIVFLLIYPLAQMKPGIKHIWIFLSSLCAFFLLESNIRSIIEVLFEDIRFSGYASDETSLSMTGFLLQLIILIFFVFKYYKLIADKSENAKFFNISFWGLNLQLYSSMIAVFFRISMYFSVINIVLLPIAMGKNMSHDNKKIEKIIIYTAVVLYLFRNGIPEYGFFWK